jgi:hypothetical protein
MDWRLRIAEFERLNPQDESGRIVAPAPRPTPKPIVDLRPIIVVVAALPLIPLGIFLPFVGFFYACVLLLLLSSDA